MCIYFPFFKFSGVISGLSSLNILIYQLIAFIIVFGFLLGFYSLVLKISKVFQKIVNMTLVLWIPSKILGALVSFIKGYLCVFICLVFLIIPLGGSNIFQDSNMINYILYKTPILSNFTGSFVNPINEIYSLSEDVSNNKISVNHWYELEGVLRNGKDADNKIMYGSSGFTDETMPEKKYYQSYSSNDGTTSISAITSV